MQRWSGSSLTAARPYVANWASGDISVLNGETGQELRRIKASSGARALAIVPAG